MPQDGQRAYHHPTVEANLRWILGDMEPFHHLVHIREDLRERDRIDEPEGA